MSKLNCGSKEWWSTNIASKNRFLSPIPSILYQIVLSLKAIKKCKKDSIDLYIFGVSWPIVLFLEQYMRTNSIDYEVKFRFVSKFHWNFVGRINNWLYLVRSFISSILNLIRSRKAFGKIDKIDKTKPVFLIKSFVFPSSFQRDHQYRDPFFGNLPLFLKDNLKEDCQIVTISQGLADRYGCYSKMNEIKDQILIPAESFLHFKDVFFASVSITLFWLIRPIRIPKGSLLFGHNQQLVLKELVKSSGRSILFGDYLYYYLARRLAKQYQLQGCLITYEGNHWEKMFVMGLKSVRPKLEVIGYQHAVIPQAAAGVFVSRHEVDIIPHPDVIVTTGTRATNILKNNSSFHSDKIKTGCALRYKYLYDLECQSVLTPETNKVKTILIALEGIVDASEMLFYAIKQAKELHDIKFIVRTHPILPLETMLNIVGKSVDDLPMNIETSNLSQVVDDIKRCDMVLYWGSTVALEALMMKKPLICFDRGDVLSFDPLSDFDDFKWTVGNSTPMIGILNQVNNMSNKEFLLRANQGEKYVSEYFEQENEENMKCFIPRLQNNK
jgi:hypothetical protein